MKTKISTKICLITNLGRCNRPKIILSFSIQFKSKMNQNFLIKLPFRKKIGLQIKAVNSMYDHESPKVTEGGGEGVRKSLNLKLKTLAFGVY